MPRLLADTAPLRNQYFRRLWLANIVTVIGAQLSVVAVPAQIYEVTGSSAYVGLTGVFGLVPLVIFGGPGSASRATIGIVVIFGVAFSTLLSLFVVPAFYALLAKYTRSPEELAHKLDKLEQETPEVSGHA